jgi:hypothetical protein
MHLLGAAIRANVDERPLNDAVNGAVHNYYSRRDSVLKVLYRVAELGQQPAGLQGESWASHHWAGASHPG